MQEALRKKLILLVFLPVVIVSILLAGTLCLSLASPPFYLWVALKGMETAIASAAVAVAAVLLIAVFMGMIHIVRITASGTKALLTTTETGHVPEKDVPDSLREDVEFNVLVRRIEQLSRGGREAPGALTKIAQTDEELRKLTLALEEVAAGSPYVPLPVKEGLAGKVISLLNRLMPEFLAARGAGPGKAQSVESLQRIEKELRETREASRELAADAERTFLESTEALVVAREASRLAAETGQRLEAVTAGAEAGTGSSLKSQKQEVRDAVTRLLEAAAFGIEDLTRGLMKASSLSRSSERIANRASVLALNISVESARASVPGMSVLADEITKLADFARACSDESSTVIKEIETKVDSAIHRMHVAQEEVRHKTRLLGLDAPDEGPLGRVPDAELAKSTERLCDSVAKLFARVQELSKLTEKSSRDAEKLNRKTAMALDKARLLARGESCESPSAQLESPEIQTLSDEDLFVEGQVVEEKEGE
jgi:methyl-accepting chemotaxis protein